MRSQRWIIGLVLLSAPAGVVMSRLWVRSDETVLSAPTSRVVSRDTGRGRMNMELSTLRRMAGD